MKVENNSENTKEAISTIEEIENPKIKPKEQSEDKEKLIGYVKERRKLMQDKRSTIDKSWKIAVKQYESIFVPYPDGRASSNVPLERAIIELFVAEAIKRPTDFNFETTLGKEFEGQVLEKVWKHDWSINNRESVILDNEYLTAIFGTSVIHTGYDKSYRVFRDYNGEDAKGKMKWQKKMQIKSDVTLENIDIRNWWVDDRAKTMEEAIDCVYECYIPYEDFLNYKLDSNYDKSDIDAIAGSSNPYDEYRPFRVKEERAEGQSGYVKITKYWNKKLDLYLEIADDSVVLKDHPILNPTHDLPFTVRQYGKNIFSIYGYGLCEALLTFKSDINKLREMIMESIKRSNQEIIAIGSNLSFDGNQFAYNNQFMKFKGNIDGNFKQLSGTPPNQAIFSRLQELFKEIAIFVGIDIMNILGDPQQTAYQTAVQKESSLQRVNVVLKNRDRAFERMADLHKNNLQMFFPLKMVRGIIELDAKDKHKEQPSYPEIEAPKSTGKSFKKGGEKEMFEITPERIRGDFKIDVCTDLNVPTINEVEKAQKMEFFSSLGSLLDTYKADPTLEKIIPKKKAIESLAKLNNIDVIKDTDAEVSEMKKELFGDLNEMMGTTRTPGASPTAEAMAGEQSPADVSTEGQPPEIQNVRTPTV